MKATKFYKLNLPETLRKENALILRAYTTNHEQSRSHETKPIKTNADQKQSRKTLKPILATRQNETKPLPMKETLINKKLNLRSAN